MLELNKIYCGDCQTVMHDIDSNSVDCIVTDPPYGMSFMGKNWDKAVPSIEIWQECQRVLKPGAFAFVMCIPRQDCLARMICRLEDAGFNISFSSVLHTFASGFPKAQNLSKVADKRAGVPSLAKAFNVAGCGDRKDLQNAKQTLKYRADYGYVHEFKTERAKVLDGAYSGMQLKPAVEIVIVVMKPLSEKTYLDQALKNGHGCTWLDDCRISFKHGETAETVTKKPSILKKNAISYIRQDELLYGGTGHSKGRFPANVLCEDDVLNDTHITKSAGSESIHQESTMFKGLGKHNRFYYSDEGSFSRYFSLDAWFAERIKLLPKEAQKTFPWLIVPKASKAEKTKNCTINSINNSDVYNGKFSDSKADKDYTNKHPTIKPIKLMSWLITLASREGDIVLDPFCGSGTTAIAAKMLSRQYIGIEKEEEYCVIARKRIAAIPPRLDSYNVL